MLQEMFADIEAELERIPLFRSCAPRVRARDGVSMQGSRTILEGVAETEVVVSLNRLQSSKDCYSSYQLNFFHQPFPSSKHPNRSYCRTLKQEGTGLKICYYTQI